MKRSLFWLGAAAMALASCTNSEVMEVAENRAIGFSSFVGKPTKAVTPVIELSDNYYVFGNYNDQSTWDGQAFNNEINTATYYWQTGKTYRFGAYADGAGGKLDNTQVSFNAADKKLTFTNYTPNDSKDLVVAATDDISADNYTGGSKVDLTFSHMLSQVKLTFTTDAAATYALTIKNVKIEQAVSTCTGTYDGTPAWETSNGTKAGYEYTEFGSTGQVISKETPASQVKLVIPQACNATDLKVTFTASIEGEKPTGTTTYTKNFTATLGHSLTTSGATANTWTAGYCYNYTAKIDIDDIVDNASSLVPITFTPSVTDWIDAGNTDVTPNPAS